MKIIFDLDGTLICSKKRLHKLFLDLTGVTNLKFKSYWDLKHQGKTNEDILRSQLSFSELEIEVFLKNWMIKIEADYYLGLDTLIPDAYKALENLNKSHDLFICTARQSISQTQKQLKKLSIFNYFKDIFVTEQKVDKFQILSNSNISFTSKDWIIGDTGNDINTGKKIGVQTCAVLSGFMSKSSLIGYSPDLIIEDFTSLDISRQSKII